MSVRKGKAPVGANPNIQENLTMQDRLLSILTLKPQSRSYLAARLHATDRELRKAVSDLRKRGLPVCSRSDGYGYWLGTAADIERTIAEYRRRGITALEIANRMEQWAENEGQVSIDDLCV